MHDHPNRAVKGCTAVLYSKKLCNDLKRVYATTGLYTGVLHTLASAATSEETEGSAHASCQLAMVLELHSGHDTGCV